MEFFMQRFYPHRKRGTIILGDNFATRKGCFVE
jgi:hypothetical protein